MTAKKNLRAKRIGGIVLLAVVIAIPAIIVALTPLAPAAVLVFAGITVGAVAALNGITLGYWMSLVSAVLLGLAILAGPQVWSATLLMVLTGLAMGACARKGWHLAVAMAAGWPVVFLIAPPWSVSGLEWTAHGAGHVLVPVGLVLLGGLWSVFILSRVEAMVPKLPLHPVAPRTAALYAVALAILLGAGAFVASTWWPDSMAGWLLLTILVIARPAISDTRERILTRSAGTIVGGLVAALLAYLIHAPGVLIGLGVLSMLVALWLYATSKNYALYALALTTAIVLLNHQGTDVSSIGLQRVGFTLVSAIVVALLMVLYVPIIRRAQRRWDEHQPESAAGKTVADAPAEETT